ncbi:MAG: thioredoxin domain-containing protein, partial [Chloroflexi bacterium]|nr:thioredoxin domain-containing protein [Chloroflexota bacterium]
PFCAQADRTVVKQLRDTYVAAGQVRFVFRQFPFIGNESVWAAMASECAGEQGKFWEYHDKLFASQSGENTGAFSRDKLEGFARDVGMTGDAFKTCLDSSKFLDRVREDAEEGQRLGVQSTPTFMVNDRRIQGAQQFAVFRDAIEAELKKKQ